MSDGGSNHTPQSSTQPTTASSANRDATTRTCLEFVEEYRKGTISRVRATASISQTLAGTTSAEAGEESVDEAFDTFLRMLKEVDQERRVDRQSPVEEEPARDQHSPRRPEPERTVVVATPAPSVRQDTPERDGDAEPERERADPSKYAWAGSGAIRALFLSDSLRATINLLQQYTVDIKRAKRDLLLTVGAPEFPSSEWDSILRGLPVDLDRVLTGMYSTTDTDEEIAQLGPYRVSAPKVQTVRKVESAGQWMYAWNWTVNATAFAFPHRLKELTEYGNHIVALFGALAIEYHPRLLDFDRAVHKRVGLRRDLELTNTSAFDDLKVQFIDACGANVDEISRLREIALESKRVTNRSPAADGTMVAAHKQVPPVATCMPAPSVGTDPTEAQNAARARLLFDLARPATRPRYMRRLIWSDEETVPVNADSSVVRAILPDVPDVVCHDAVVNDTLQRRPDLFPIVTPIDVDHLHALLWRHPNQPYVDSVCRALREGFWPWADPTCGDYPDTHDELLTSPLDERVRQFLREQRDEEIRSRRFSQSFGRNLLPGMYSMPIHAVPKPNTDKLRLVTNHSAGRFALNGMITKEAIAGVVMDGVPAIGCALRRFRREHGSTVRLTMWKSDVSHAYRLIPMSPYWQIKQVVTIDGERYVDHNNVFGGRGSERAFDSMNTLVNWVAKHERGISDLMNYVDDNFAFDISGNTAYYVPYGKDMPARQARLLMLWDELGIPHEERKQLNGETLTIIGFEIDPNAMTATLPAESKQKLLHHVRSFCDAPKGGRRRSLKEFQSLTGYLNWAFNVFPLLKPSLSNVYDKLAGKTNPHAGIHINRAIVNDLSWLASHVDNASGICFLDAEPWGPDELDWADPHCEIAYTDASALGIGLWFPWHKTGYFCDLPGNAPADTIFFFEALAVCCAMHRIVQYRRDTGCLPLRRFGGYSDNTNSVNIFDSLRAKPPYNPILTSAIDLSIAEAFQFRVQHIPGRDNVIADALSRRQFDFVVELVPDVTISPFEPPRDALGALRK